MEFSEVKRISKFFLLRGLKVEKIQIAEIVFEIVSGSFHDILVNLCDYFFILDTESIQELCGGSLIPALIVDTGIKQRINTEVDTAVFPHQGGDISSSLVGEKGSGILISVGFDISRPAFNIAARGDQLSDVVRLCLSEKNSLVQMPRKSFVG